MSQSYLATDLMDLSLNAGDLVGVIQEKDPMGNRDRWFVDNGGEGWPQIISDIKYKKNMYTHVFYYLLFSFLEKYIYNDL